jgi:hypothetical protein
MAVSVGFIITVSKALSFSMDVLSSSIISIVFCVSGRETAVVAAAVGAGIADEIFCVSFSRAPTLHTVRTYYVFKYLTT